MEQQTLIEKIKKILPGKEFTDDDRKAASERLIRARSFLASARDNLAGANRDLRLATDVLRHDRQVVASGFVPPNVNAEDMLKFSSWQFQRCENVVNHWEARIKEGQEELKAAETNFKKVFDCDKLPEVFDSNGWPIR